MEREQMQKCLATVAAFHATGQRVHEWAPANGVSARALSSWCSHAARWQAKLDGVHTPPGQRKKSATDGFVSASLPQSIGAIVRVEIQSGQSRIQLHWPLGHARELAALVREVGR